MSETENKNTEPSERNKMKKNIIKNHHQHERSMNKTKKKKKASVQHQE